MVSERLLGYIRFPCACDLSLILGVRFDDELASGSDGDDDNMDDLDESGGNMPYNWGKQSCFERTTSREIGRQGALLPGA